MVWAWTNHGLPMYVTIDWKPENGCEIQNAACGQSDGVMVHLRLVKTAEEKNANGTVKEMARMGLHFIAVMKAATKNFL